MLVRDDKFEVLHAERTEDGTKIDPEAKPARRLLDVSAPPTAQAGASAEFQAILAKSLFNISVSIEMPAIDLAKGAATACVMCKHWDTEAMRAWIRAKSSTKAGIQELNGFRGELMMNGNMAVQSQHQVEDEFDVDHALNSMGICHPLTECERDVIFTHPGAQCPAFLRNGAPFPQSFKPRTQDDVHQSSKAFDDVMLTAAGKK